MVKQTTLVALYGDKPKALVTLIQQCQEIIETVPGIEFEPYDIRQVHTTLLGYCTVAASPLHNLNLAQYRDRLAVMDIAGFMAFLKTSGYLPFQVQVGGFHPRDYPFTSRGQRPFDRSFSVQGNKAVMLGWPIRGVPLRSPPTSIPEQLQEGRLYPLVLDQLRQAAQSFNILHTYHRQPTDVDNDFYFRIGLLNPDSLSSEAQHNLETVVRKFLSRLPPLIVEVSEAEVAIATYTDERLPVDSTQIIPLETFNLTSDQIRSLYQP